ncbi:MAG TPA: type II secretion system protein [Nitrospirota bacterium]|nr:type II secretion system protein [Nitrospirota bacterium]
MGSSAYRIQGAHSFTFHRFHTCSGKSAGFAYIALLAVIVIIGISLGVAGKYWQNVMLRDKEEELLFRGDQYRRAIERYYFAFPGRPQYPQSIDDLLTDSRTAVGKHYLRRKYKDPITGGDFIVIHDPLTNRIAGVHSGSDKTPLKKANFPKADADFEGKTKYSDWQFVPNIQGAPTGTAAPVAQGKIP